MVLNVGVLLHCEGGSRGLRRRRRLESDGVYGVYEDGRLRLRLHLVFERGLGC